MRGPMNVKSCLRYSCQNCFTLNFSECCIYYTRYNSYLPTAWTKICICTMQMNMLSVKMFRAELLEIKHAGRVLYDCQDFVATALTLR